MSIKPIRNWQPWLLAGLTICGLAARLYGFNWDEGQNLHYDENTVVSHAFDLRWPSSLTQFFDAAHSPLNPHFFAYGSFPMYLLALVGYLLLHDQAANLVNFHYLARILSALFDTGTVLLAARLSFLLTPREYGKRWSWYVALLVTALVSFTPLQLQYSHFYTVDIMLLFFVMLTLLACVSLVESTRPIPWLLLAGAGYGLAVATKSGAVLLVIPICVAVGLRWYRERKIGQALSALAIVGNITLISFLLAMPYGFLDRSNFLADITLQGSMVMRGEPHFNFIWEFEGTTPFLFQGREMLLWGLGVTLGLATLGGAGWLLWHIYHQRHTRWLILFSWLLVYGTLMGSAFVKPMRYMLPIYPLLTLLAASALIAFARFAWNLGQTEQISEEALVVAGGRSRVRDQVQHREAGSQADRQAGDRETVELAVEAVRTSEIPPAERVRRERTARGLACALIVLVLAGTLFQGIAMVNIYSQRNTRIQASLWMYEHLKPGSVISYEWFDVPNLPLVVDGHDPSTFVQASYQDDAGNRLTGISPYSHETQEKAHLLALFLSKLDALILGSESVGASLRAEHPGYPLDDQFQQLLIHGQLGLHLAAQFSDHPHFLGVTLDESGADQGLTIFDHSTASVFVRDTPYNYTPDQLYQKLIAGLDLPAR